MRMGTNTQCEGHIRVTEVHQTDQNMLTKVSYTIFTHSYGVEKNNFTFIISIPLSKNKI